MNANIFTDMAAENGWTKAEEAQLREEVRLRLTPVRFVEIPGLGVSLPVYADQS